MLRPVETPTREIKKLDGLWAFSLDRENCGIDAYRRFVPYVEGYPTDIGFSAKSLYRKVGQASVSCCVSMRSLITAKCGSIIRK